MSGKMARKAAKDLYVMTEELADGSVVYHAAETPRDALAQADAEQGPLMLYKWVETAHYETQVVKR